MMEYKIVDGENVEKKVEKLTSDEREDLFTCLVMGKDVTSTVETSRGEFVVKFPKQKDVVSIGRVMAYWRNGLSSSSFDKVSERAIMVCSSLDIVVTDGPEWYKKAKKASGSFSFQEVPDIQFLEELYAKALEFREQVQEKLDTPQKTKSKRLPSAKNDGDSLDSGAFENLSLGLEDSGAGADTD